MSKVLWNKSPNILLGLLLISSIAFSQSVNQRQEDSLTNAWNKQVLGKPLPAFVASGDDGVVTNDSLPGKVTYINMWEASCAPCMAEMSTLNKLYDTLRDNPDFQFISISSDDEETIHRIKTKYHIEFNVYHLDEAGCFLLNGGMGYPTAMIVGKNGKLIYTHAGGEIESRKIWRFIFITDIYPIIIKEL